MVWAGNAAFPSTTVTVGGGADVEVPEEGLPPSLDWAGVEVGVAGAEGVETTDGRVVGSDALVGTG